MILLTHQHRTYYSCNFNLHLCPYKAYINKSVVPIVKNLEKPKTLTVTLTYVYH